MCEQTEVQYLPDEVVWVKLHQPSLWWPGQVQDYDKLPEDVTEGLRKKPIAIVKFFQEDTFEYVNNFNHIYHYNCSKKYDFIKKGLAMARWRRPERPSHMDLFPQDVATAETLTHGNPDIIRDEAFAPEEKPKYEGLFGTEKKKKPKSVVESILKERPSWRVKPLLTKLSGSPKTPSPSKISKVITHPRFINKVLKGETDHKVCIREQPIVEDETASPSSEYRCHSCDFVTARLNVIVLHYRSHSKSTTPIPRPKVPKPKSAKVSVTKPKVETPTKTVPTEPFKKRNILKETSPAPSEKTEKVSPKKSPKTPAPKPQAPKRKAKTEIKPEVEGKKVKKEEIQELLKDWSDEELEEESQIVGRASDDEEASREGNAGSKRDEPSEKADSTQPNEKAVEVKEDEKKKEKPLPAKSKAVFDFDDDDDGLDPKLTHNSRVFGRKIPRVIDNIKERKSFVDVDSSDETKKEKKRRKSAVEDVPSEEIAEEPTEKESVEQVERQKELESMNAEIDSLLEKTALPDLPEIPKLNAFSMDVTDDGEVPTDKSKEEEKCVLREHNDISPNNVEVEPSKNSLPEVDSAVEAISTPPQADSVGITAEIQVSKPDVVKSAVITSVVLSGPQSTSGGDHSYVSEKRPPISVMPPLVPTSPKSPHAKSRTYILSRSSAVKSSTREDAGTVKVASVKPPTTKAIPALVNKDGKYVIVTQSGDLRVMPSLTPTSAPTTKVIPQPQLGKKFVIMTKNSSGNVVLSSQKQANILSKSSTKSSMVKPQLQKAAETRTVTMPPKKNIVLTSQGGIRDPKTYLVPVSSVHTKSPAPAVLTTRAPGGSKPIVLPQTVKLVSSKDTPGKVVLQMDSQQTKVTFPSMKRAHVKASKEASSATSSQSLKMISVGSSPKTSTTSPKPLTALTSPKLWTTVSSPKTLTAVASPKTLTAVASPKTPPKSTTNKFFHRDTSSAQPIRTPPKKQTVPVKKVVPSKALGPATVAHVLSKPSILQPTPRSIVRRTVPPKTTKESTTTKEAVPSTAQEAVVSTLEPGSFVATPVEGGDGAAIMYILDNGTLISYDQTQGDAQGRTVFIDPASLSASSGDLSNLIFTFDESVGSEGTLLSIAPPEGTPEFAFAPATERPASSTTQDILAEALANTQVLQAEASASELILDSSSLATNTIPSSSALYPNNVLTLSNNVLETSLTLNAPIMTPLEVPSAVSSLQPPPVASGTLELPITVAQPDITISTSSYASLPIPSATIQGTVFSDSTTATYSTMVPVLSGDANKQTFFIEATDAQGATFELAEGGSAVFACADQTEAGSLIEAVEETASAETSDA